MEKQLLKLFEIVKKAADSADETRCIEAMKKLKDFPVNSKILIHTQVGRDLRRLTKHPRSKIQACAVDLIAIWKKTVVEESNQENSKKRKSDSKLSSDGEKRPAKMVKSSDTSDSVFINQDEDQMSPSSVLSKPIQFRQGARGKVQKLLWEGLTKVDGEIDESFRVAISVESALFDKLGCSTTGNCRAKYRSIIFNIKHQKNPEFRRKVLLGEIKAESIPLLTSEEMASDERRKEIQLIMNRALWDCERSEEDKATTDQFKCDRCGKRECSFYQLQTRSADEPMTTYVTCQSCKYHWKFC